MIIWDFVSYSILGFKNPDQYRLKWETDTVIQALASTQLFLLYFIYTVYMKQTLTRTIYSINFRQNFGVSLAHLCKCICTMSRNARRLTGLLRSAGRICLPSTCSLNLRRASSSVALCPALPSFPSTRPRSRASKCPEQDTGERGNQQKNTKFECLLTN